MPTTHLDPIQAGAQITRHNEQWGTTLGTAYGPITYGFRSTSTTGSSIERTTFSKVNAAEMAAVDDAMRLWSNVAHVTFTPVNPGGYTNSATILVANYSSSSDGAAAYAYYPSPGSTGSTNSAGDVWINAYYQSNLSPSPGNYAYMAILHEVGHALGLEHPGNYNAGPGATITYAKNAEYVEDSRQYTVMSYFDASATGANHVYQGTTIRASTPLLHDITAIQRLYGANTEFATGDTTYGFNSNADPAYRISSSTQQVVYCIWDGGGNDTLDVSGYGTNQTIDLRAASFSDIGALTKNVSIAVGALIENAIGGSGNDTMIGNEVANHLVGGNGDDRLTGNSGDDLLDGGAGFDTAVFQGLRATYTILTVGIDIRVFGAEGIDDLVSIEALQFSDVTVTLDGLLPTLGIAGLAPVGAEGTGATTSLTFTVILDKASLTTQTVDWAVSGSGAHGATAADFAGGVLPTGVLTFTAGETSKTIAVAVSADTTVEFDEGFTVTLSNASSGSVIGTPAANGTILNDDKSAVSIGVLAVDKAEGAGGTTPFTFTVSLDQAGVAAQTVGWSVTGSGDPAASAADFGGTLPSGTVSFAAGEISKTVTVAVSGDGAVEGDEAFAVSLSAPSSGLAIAAATALGTIRNDDASVSIAALAADKAEAQSGTTTFTFTVARTGDISLPHSVDYAVSGSGAAPASAADFAGSSLPWGTLTFAAEETSKTITVAVQGDISVEPDETFAVTLSAPSAGLTIGTASAVGTIRNDDASVSIEGLAADQAEGQIGVTALTFRLTRTGDSTATHSVAYSVGGSGANAASPADFSGGTPPSGVVTFAPGELTKQIAVNVMADGAIEPDETFTVGLSTPSTGLLIEGASAIGTIRNDDASVSITALSASAPEGNSGATAFAFTLKLTGDTSLPRTVAYAVTGTGADPASGSDFVGGQLPTGVVTFAAGEASRTLVVSVSGDSEIEADQAFAVTLSSPSLGLSIGTATAAATILNDDAIVSIAAAVVDEAEGNSGVTAFTFTLIRTGDSAASQTVAYAVIGSGANPVSAGDFLGGVLPSGIVTFAAGETSKTIVVSVAGDTQVEPDETFAVSLSNPSSGLGIGNATATGTIRNEDAAVSIAALSATLLEGNLGNAVATFTVTLTGDSSVGHSVAYAVSGSGASPAAAGDFAGGILPSGAISFAAGETSKTITLDVAGDAQVEPDETFAVSLSNPSSGLVIATATAVGAIRNDDASVSIAPSAADRSEGHAGATGFSFVLTLAGDSSASHSVAYAVTGSGGNPAAAADFAGGLLASGIVTFVAGEISRTIVIDVSGDAQVEPDETFTVSLSNPSAGLGLGAASATGTIRNDDAVVSIAADTAGQPEGNSGATAFAFTLSLTGDSTVAHSVAYAVSGSGSDPVSAGDFLGGVLPSGVVTFASGETSKTIVVSVSGDTAVEPDRTFTVSLSAPSTGLGIAVASAVATIRNDDAVVSVAALSATREEGQSGATSFTFVLTRSGETSASHSVDYAVSGLGANPASGADFAGGLLPSGTVSFAAGETSRTIVVTVAGDTALEPDETFALSLSNPSTGLSVAMATATGTIRNDDASVSIAPLSAGPSEGNAEGAAATFMLTLSGDSSVSHSVAYAVIGSGVAPASADDFAGSVLPSGSVTFASGETTRIVTVNLAADAVVEPDETFTVSLSAPSPGLIVGTATAVGTLRNDDAVVSIATLSALQSEANSGTTSFTFALTLTGDSTQARSVAYAVSGSGVTPAVAGDFLGGSLPSGTVTFVAGETSKTIVISVSGDTAVEADETFTVSLSSPSPGLTIATAMAVGTIRNDDASVSADVLAADVPEGDSGATGYSFVLTLTGDSSVPHSVAYGVNGAGGNPASDTDFVGGALPSGIVSFAAGETSKTIVVSVAADHAVEHDEGFALALSNASAGLIIGTSTAVGTIVNDDKPAVSIALLAADKAEGNAGTTPFTFTFTVTLDQPALAAQSVDWSVTPMGASSADASDFGGALPSGTVSFVAGETSKTVTVGVSGDVIVEPDETFAVALSNPSSGLSIATATVAGVIRNDDASVSIVALAADRTEGDLGTTSFTFTVMRAGDSSVAHSVAYSVSGTGASPALAANFMGGVLPAGVVSFAAGETSKTISLVIAGDTMVEPDETFAVTLSSPSAGLVVGTPTAPGTIRNDDASVSIVALSASLREGNAGATAATFTLLRSGDNSVSHSVAYAVSGSGAAPASASDFTGSALPAGVVTFAPGEASRTVSVSLAGDIVAEPDESFVVSLSNPSTGLAVETATAAGLIVNDDAIVSLTAGAASQGEGNAGTTAFVFTLTLAGDSTVSHSVAYAVTGSGPNPAAAGDFIGGVLPAGTLTFAAGETTRTIFVAVAGDTRVERDGAFTVTLSDPSAGLVLGTAGASATIQNDDKSAVSIVALSADKAEGNGASTPFTFTVSLDQAGVAAQTIDWTVAGTGPQAADAADFGGMLPSGTVTFAVGETSKTIAVPVSGDASLEVDEAFTVSLTAPSAGLAIAVATAAGTIRDDEASVAIAAPSGGVVEGNAGTAVVIFTLTLSGDSSVPRSVAYAVSGSGANPAGPGDFAGGSLPSGVVTFTAGETTRTLSLALAGDGVVEADETFIVTLSSPSSGLTLATASAAATILNDDASVSIAALSADRAEGNAGSTAFTFQVTRSGDVSVSHSVAYSVSGTGTNLASAGDFTGGALPSGLITFAPGETSKSVVVNVAGDLTAESNESFAISLSGPSAGLAVVMATAGGTIRNDDMDAHDDAYVGLRGQSLHIAATGGVLANDEGTVPTTAVVLVGPAHGSVALASDGSFDYAPAAGFVGIDSFVYRATGAHGTDEAQVLIYLTPVSTGASVTLDLLALSAEQQIAATYTTFFGRGADAAGFAFWVDQFNTSLPVQGPAALFANIASAFGFSTEARNLYPFLASPYGATDGQIGAFIDSVYNNLFNRSSDAAGLAYWTGQVRQVLASGQFVGSVLVDIIGGAQNSVAGQDITTLMGKVAVNLEYVQEQQRLGTLWTAADDGAEASALMRGVTADPRTVLVGIAQAQNLVSADTHG